MPNLNICGSKKEMKSLFKKI